LALHPTLETTLGADPGKTCFIVGFQSLKCGAGAQALMQNSMRRGLTAPEGNI